MKKNFPLILLLLVLPLDSGCANNPAPIINTVTYSAVVAEKAILDIQTITIAQNKAGAITKEQALPIMDAIVKANNTMKLVSAALKTWDSLGDNASLKTLLPELRSNINDIKAKLPTNMQGIISLIEAFANFNGWYITVEAGVK